MIQLDSFASLKLKREINLFGGKSATYVYYFGTGEFVGPIVAAAVVIKWPLILPDSFLNGSKKNTIKDFIVDSSVVIIGAEEINKTKIKTAVVAAQLEVLKKIRNRNENGPVVSYHRLPKSHKDIYFCPTFRHDFIGTRFAEEVARIEYHNYLKTANIKNEIRNTIARVFLS